MADCILIPGKNLTSHSRNTHLRPIYLSIQTGSYKNSQDIYFGQH